jgi:hypothetical protein
MQTNLNPLFIDQIVNFAHLIKPVPQTKSEFLQTIKSNYDTSNPKTQLFYIATEKSTFENICLNKTRDAILFNQ